MRLLLFPLTFLSFNLFSGNTIFSDDLDEFTDEREIFIAVVGDEHNSILSEFIGIYCDTENEPRMVLKKGIVISLKSYLSVTFRFDKNKPITKDFRVNNSNNLLFTQDIYFINSFLYELRNSNDLIAKIEDESEIMRHTDLNNSEKHVTEFMNAASEMPSSTCNLF